MAMKNYVSGPTWNVSYMGIFIKKLWQFFTPCKALRGQSFTGIRPCFAPPHKALIHIKPTPLGFTLHVTPKTGINLAVNYLQ
jgi:hypothetical protein